MFSSFMCVAQNLSQNCQKEFIQFYKYYEQEDYEKHYMLTPDKYFKPFNRKIFIKARTRGKESPDHVKEKYSNFKFNKIDSIGFFENKCYVFIDFSCSLYIGLSSEFKFDENDVKVQRLRSTTRSYEKQYGKENVVLVPEEDRYDITIKKIACAISENGLDNWQFCPEPVLYVKNILPKAVKAIYKKKYPTE